MKSIGIDIDTIYPGDCLEWLPLIKDNSVDLVFTSPPYNTKKGKSLNPNLGNFYPNYKDNLCDNDYFNLLYVCIKESLRISRYVFINLQVLSNNKTVVIDIISAFKLNLKDIFIWNNKAVPQIVKGKMATGFEFVFLFGQDSTMHFRDYNNFPPNNYVPNRQTWCKKGNKDISINRATFPLELPEYFISNFYKRG